MKDAFARALAGVSIVVCVAAPAAVRAEDDEGVRHFRTGVRLFKDGNFSGALAEFEEAHRLRPTASALQNIALCQKALFRYSEAIATLSRMQAQYGASLSSDDAKAAADTIAELRGLVTQVTIAVDPADAIVTVDGRPIAGGTERRVELDVGEHRLTAEAARYRRADRMITVAGRDKRFEVKLEADLGEIVVVSDDADAAIVVDGSATLGYGTWTGKVTAGEHHTITVYKPGYQPTTLDVVVSYGESRKVTATLGEKVRGPAPPTPFPYVRPPSAQRHGPYGFLTTTFSSVNADPDNFVLPGNNTNRSGASAGLRVGWLLTHNVGIEAMLEGGKISVGPGCATSSGACADAVPPSQAASYSLSAARAGANGRYISGGETWRFLGVLGVGAVSHTLEISAQGTTLPSGKTSALNGYLLFEGGGEVSIGRVLVDVVLTATVDGVSNLKLADRTLYTAHSGNVTYGGLGLRVGYALW